jgi:hypothetical protein
MRVNIPVALLLLVLLPFACDAATYRVACAAPLCNANCDRTSDGLPTGKEEECAAYCVSEGCGSECEGTNCAEGCVGVNCGKDCVGGETVTYVDCGKGCHGDGCGQATSLLKTTFASTCDEINTNRWALKGEGTWTLTTRAAFLHACEHPLNNNPPWKGASPCLFDHTTNTCAIHPSVAARLLQGETGVPKAASAASASSAAIATVVVATVAAIAAGN